MHHEQIISNKLFEVTVYKIFTSLREVLLLDLTRGQEIELNSIEVNASDRANSGFGFDSTFHFRDILNANRSRNTFVAFVSRLRLISSRVASDAFDRRSRPSIRMPFRSRTLIPFDFRGEKN